MTGALIAIIFLISGIAIYRDAKARKELAAWREKYPKLCYSRDWDVIAEKIGGME